MTSLLVVDDSAMDRRVAGGLLEKQGDWSIIYAADGQLALDQIELHLPDLVITDLQMPVMDGLQLVAKIREEYPLMPVVLMTAQGSEEIAVEALKQGAASYVPKRHLTRDLAETVQIVLSASSSERGFSRLMHRMTRHECDFHIENDLLLIPSIVNYLQEQMTRMRFGDETDRLRVGVALEEALLNAYYHGNLEVSSTLREQDHQAYYDLARRRLDEEPYRQRRIFISARLSPTEHIYVIRDEGFGFDPSTLPDPTDPANIESPCGRGLLLMQTFMDEVTFNAVGNEVTMTKRPGTVSPGPARNEPSADEPNADEPTSDEVIFDD